MARLLLVRHAQSTWNADNRWQGWSDPPLSQLGEHEAKLAGCHLAAMGFRPELVASSDLRRARRTAELLAEALGYGGSLVADPDLREQDVGLWSGLTRQEIEARWPLELAQRDAGLLGTVPGGENCDDFSERCLRALERLTCLGASEVLVVSHGGVVMAVERALGASEPSWRHPNLAGWWIEARGERPDLELRTVEPVALLAAVPEAVGDIP